jgi:hypothetical protein
MKFVKEEKERLIMKTSSKIVYLFKLSIAIKSREVCHFHQKSSKAAFSISDAAIQSFSLADFTLNFLAKVSRNRHLNRL